MPSHTQKSLFHGTTYTEADKFLSDKGTDCMAIANNTVLHRVAEGTIAVRLHQTDVVTYYSGTDKVKLSSGGWNTPTTARRIGQFSQHKVSLGTVGPSLVAPYGNWDNATAFNDSVMV